MSFIVAGLYLLRIFIKLSQIFVEESGILVELYIVWNFKCSYFLGSITRLCRVPVWPGLSQLLQASTLWPSMPPTMASSHSSWWSNETFVVQVGMFPRIPPFWEPGHGQNFLETLETQNLGRAANNGTPWTPVAKVTMDKWWSMLRFLGNMNNISIFIGFSCISTRERDFTHQPHDRRNALNQDLLKDQLTGMCNTTISIWPSFKASRDVVRQELWEHLGSWNCGPTWPRSETSCPVAETWPNCKYIYIYMCFHLSTPRQVQRILTCLYFPKRVASCLLSLPHLVHVHHKYHDI